MCIRRSVCVYVEAFTLLYVGRCLSRTTVSCAWTLHFPAAFLVCSYVCMSIRRSVCVYVEVRLRRRHPLLDDSVLRLDCRSFSCVWNPHCGYTLYTSNDSVLRLDAPLPGSSILAAAGSGSPGKVSPRRETLASSHHHLDPIPHSPLPTTNNEAPGVR